MLRAYDKKTGAQVGEVLLPAPIVGMPMTYSLNGRQYIVVGVSGGNYRGEYISIAGPSGISALSGKRVSSSRLRVMASPILLGKVTQ